MGALNIFNYLDLSEKNICDIVAYIENYISDTAYFEIEDITGVDIGKAHVYVAFDLSHHEVKIKDLTIQDTTHHFDMQRDSSFVRWIIETDLHRINRDKKRAYQYSETIRAEQSEILIQGI